MHPLTCATSLITVKCESSVACASEATLSVLAVVLTTSIVLKTFVHCRGLQMNATLRKCTLCLPDGVVGADVDGVVGADIVL